MESNDKLKEISFKNCTCYYVDVIIKRLKILKKIEDFGFDNILIFIQ